MPHLRKVLHVLHSLTPLLFFPCHTHRWVVEEVSKIQGAFLGPKAVDALGWWVRHGLEKSAKIKDTMILGVLSSHSNRLDLYEISFQVGPWRVDNLVLQVGVYSILLLIRFSFSLSLQSTSMPTRPFKATLLPGQEGREVAVRECPLEGEAPFVQAFGLTDTKIPHSSLPPGPNDDFNQREDRMMPRFQPSLPTDPLVAKIRPVEETTMTSHSGWALHEEMVRLRLQIQALQHQMDRMEARTVNKPPW